jgi:hypothetical protein
MGTPLIAAGPLRARLGLPEHANLRGVPEVERGRYDYRQVLRWLRRKFAAGDRPLLGLTSLDDVVSD